MKGKTKKINTIIYFLLTVLIILSLIYIINFFSLKQEAKAQSNLLNSVEIYNNETTNDITQNILENNNKVTEENEQTAIIENEEGQKEENEGTKETERMLQVKILI